MKSFKRIITLILAVILLGCLTSISVSAKANDMITVSLRIEGVKETMYFYEKVSIEIGASIADLMERIEETENAPEIVADDLWYIREIDGLTEGAYGAYSGWLFRHNGNDLMSGIDENYLSNNDEIVCFYGNPWGGPGMQYPVQPDISRLFSEGVVQFTSIDTLYSEDGTPTFMENPIAGATVTLNGAVYTTNEEGEIEIVEKSGISGFRSLQIERYDEGSGVPTVLRFAPGFKTYIPFIDIPENEWYKDAIKYCVGKGYFVGTEPAYNLFDPMMNMTMAQLITVLARISGTEVDGMADPWYAPALEWALDNEIVAGDNFADGEFITRETFIYMFHLTASLAGIYNMEVSSDLSVAIDYDDINDNYLEAISWAVASGVIEGTGNGELVISPYYEVNRATVCQMLYNYYIRAEG